MKDVIEQGDLVDFGEFGTLYVIDVGNKEAFGNQFKVVGEEDKRNNEESSGSWLIHQQWALGIVEKNRKV